MDPTATRELGRLARCLVPREIDEMIAVFSRDRGRRARAFERLRLRRRDAHLIAPYTHESRTRG